MITSKIGNLTPVDTYIHKYIHTVVVARVTVRGKAIITLYNNGKDERGRDWLPFLTWSQAGWAGL